MNRHPANLSSTPREFFTVRPEAAIDVAETRGVIYASKLLARHDTNRAYSTFAPVTQGDCGNWFFIGAPVSLWDDQVEPVLADEIAA